MRAKIMAAMAALAASLAMAAPAAQAASCGPHWQEWQCPPYSEFHATYGPSTTFLNLGNAENRATSYAYQELGHITEGWTGTAWSYRVSSTHVVAAIWVFNPSTRTAWRASYDVYGSNSFNQGVYGHVEWQQQY
jgi:hypothetical protein